MRNWNIHDADLIRRLDASLAGAPVAVERGPEGGVALYVSDRFLGVWVEFQPNLFSFVPAAYLQPTHSHLTLEQAVEATALLIKDALRPPLPIRRIA